MSDILVDNVNCCGPSKSFAAVAVFLIYSICARAFVPLLCPWDAQHPLLSWQCEGPLQHIAAVETAPGTGCITPVEDRVRICDMHCATRRCIVSEDLNEGGMWAISQTRDLT